MDMILVRSSTFPHGVWRFQAPLASPGGLFVDARTGARQARGAQPVDGTPPALVVPGNPPLGSISRRATD